MIHTTNPAVGRLIRKVNRFLALVDVDGRAEKAHIPNSGRLTELMTPGAEAILEPASNPERKTAFTLKALRFMNRWVCIDSTIPNALAEEMARTGALPCFDGYTSVRREFTLGAHRYDLRLDGGSAAPMIVEVKSVTLVREKVALFPDAPTKRGVSHLNALAAMDPGQFRRLVLFVIQRADARLFRPNTGADPDFAIALRKAAGQGVSIIAVKCAVGSKSIRVTGDVPLELDE